MNVIITERLILRTWKCEDAEPYWQINQDAQVVEFLATSVSMDEVLQHIEGNNAAFARDKFCFFAVENRSTGELMGFVGLHRPRFQAHFTPCVEIGWRLGSQYWGNGYATEAARAVVAYAFDVLHLDEIVSFTVPANVRSRRVMEKIGMTRDTEGDFAHPRLSSEHPLSLHVLYRLPRAVWEKRAKETKNNE